MGVPDKVKDLSGNLGEKLFHPWNFKSLFNILLLFSLCREQQVRDCLRRPCKLAPAFVPTTWRKQQGKGGQGNLIGVPVSPAFCKVSSPWELDFAWSAREWKATSWLNLGSYLLQGDTWAGAGLRNNYRYQEMQGDSSPVTFVPYKCTQCTGYFTEHFHGYCLIYY